MMEKLIIFCLYTNEKNMRWTLKIYLLCTRESNGKIGNDIILNFAFASEGTILQ